MPQSLLERVPQTVAGVVINDLRLVCELDYLLETYANDVTVYHINCGRAPGNHRTEREILEVVKKARGYNVLVEVNNRLSKQDLVDAGLA